LPTFSGQGGPFGLEVEMAVSALATETKGGAGAIENNRSPSKGAYSPAPLPKQLKKLNCLRTCAPTIIILN
jgi:hypothetical protein